MLISCLSSGAFNEKNADVFFLEDKESLSG